MVLLERLKVLLPIIFLVPIGTLLGEPRLGFPFRLSRQFIPFIFEGFYFVAHFSSLQLLFSSLLANMASR